MSNFEQNGLYGLSPFPLAFHSKRAAIALNPNALPFSPKKSCPLRDGLINLILCSQPSSPYIETIVPRVYTNEIVANFVASHEDNQTPQCQLAQSSQVALKANPLAQIFVPTDITDLNLSTRKNESNYEHSLLDVTPAVQEIRTPGSFVSTQTVFDDECDARVKINNAFLLEKYNSDNFCENIDTDNVEVSQVLKQIRIDNVTLLSGT